MDNKILEPSCPNCARLEDQLYHESRKAPEVEYKLGHEIEVLRTQLEMCKFTFKMSCYCDDPSYRSVEKCQPCAALDKLEGEK